MSDSSLNSLIDLYDTEFFAIERVVQKLNESSGKARQMEPFRKEIIERFQEIGLVVSVKCWSTNVDRAYAFDVEIIDRCTPLPNGFDHELQAWAVQNNILGIESAGSYGIDGRIITPSKSISFAKKD